MYNVAKNNFVYTNKIYYEYTNNIINKILQIPNSKYNILQHIYRFCNKIIYIYVNIATYLYKYIKYCNIYKDIYIYIYIYNDNFIFL